MEVSGSGHCSHSDPKVSFWYGRVTEMFNWNQSHFPKECAISVFRAGMNKNVHSVKTWAIVSIGYQQQRRKAAAGKMPSKKLLMKRKGESEGPVLGSIFILAELQQSLQRKEDCFAPGKCLSPGAESGLDQIGKSSSVSYQLEGQWENRIHLSWRRFLSRTTQKATIRREKGRAVGVTQFPEWRSFLK